MAEFLFVTWDGGGNVPPLLGIAAELQTRGHGVRVLGHPVQAEEVARAGLELTAYSQGKPFVGRDQHGPLAWIAMFGDRGMGHDLLAELERQPADLVVIDCLAFGAMESARQAGVKYAVVEHMFDAYFREKWLRGPIGLGMKLKRLAPAKSLEAAELTLVASLPQLDPAGASSSLTYCGPIVTGVPAAAPEPRILVSLSTVGFPGQTSAMQRILEACADLPAGVVVTTGPAVDPSELELPANAEAHRFVPHADLMPTVSLVIGHGGHATTMTALAHDLPLLVVPMHPLLDQPMVGRAVEAAGAGRMLPKKASPARLRPVIEELLGDGPHRAAAARLGAAIRASGGVATAADELLAVVRNGAART